MEFKRYYYVGLRNGRCVICKNSEDMNENRNKIKIKILIGMNFDLCTIFKLYFKYK